MTSGHGGKVSASSKLSQSNVREITKRRDKPYKTEQATVLAKKKKLDLRISYTAAPPGYVFVPLGTPDLAELCKEISRQRDYSVNVVNAKPANRTVMDPGKVSHHIQRIGYHFRNEAVEEACTRLRYTIFQGEFISEAELQKRQNESFLARVMAKYGLQAVSEASKETPEQVSSAIKELFPKIPAKDLEEIVNHAWAEGSSRVGTASDLDLSRRVQLAVIARIRHNYTDYDRLLKAFDWIHARKEVEADCLKKLIEWRGEQELGEDNGLEEIVRETIVIDDEDDAPRLRQKALQRGFTPGTGPGDASDTSIEIVHRPAIANDLRAEDPQEQQHRYFQPRGPARRTVAERTDIARAKIDAVRGQMRAQHPRPGYDAPSEPSSEDMTRVTIDECDGTPREIIVNGVIMRRATPERAGYALPVQLQQISSRPLPPLPYQYPQTSHRRQDIPIPSIEPIATSRHQRHFSDHQSPTYPDINTTTFQDEYHASRHGEPPSLRYRQVHSAMQQPPQYSQFYAQQSQPPTAMHSSLPQMMPQTWSTQAPLPPLLGTQRSVLSWPINAPLPPVPSAQSGTRLHAPYPAQPKMMPLPDQRYSASVPRPVHGAPAPVQPASSKAKSQPYEQYWYE